MNPLKVVHSTPYQTPKLQKLRFRSVDWQHAWSFQSLIKSETFHQTNTLSTATEKWPQRRKDHMSSHSHCRLKKYLKTDIKGRWSKIGWFLNFWVIEGNKAFWKMVNSRFKSYQFFEWDTIKIFTYWDIFKFPVSCPVLSFSKLWNLLIFTYNNSQWNLHTVLIDEGQGPAQGTYFGRHKHNNVINSFAWKKTSNS